MTEVLPMPSQLDGDIPPGQSSSCHINRQLIPVKVNYFCQFVVISVLFLYMNPILAQSGLSASQLGLTALITNASITCARLISGPVMDRSKKKNRILLVLSLVTAGFILCFLGLPKEREYVMEGQFDKNAYFVARVHADVVKEEDSGLTWVLKQSSTKTDLNYDAVCWPTLVSGCSVSYHTDPNLGVVKFDLELSPTDQTNRTAAYSIQTLPNSQPRNLWTSGNDTVLVCSHLSSAANQSHCLPLRNERIKPASYVTVAMSLILRTVVSCAHSPIINLLESVTFGILGPEKAKYFGQTRLAGSLGYISGALVIGLIISTASQTSIRQFVRFPATPVHDSSIRVNYTPSILMGTGFVVLGALTTLCIKQNPTRSRLKMHQAILTAFRSAEMIQCMINCLLTGFVLSLLAEYFTLILTTQYDLSHSFIGLLVSTIILTEVPMFFVSGSLVVRFGPMLCLCMAHLIWTVYFAAIAFVSNPWALLVAQTWSGLAFPLANNAILHQAAMVGCDKTLCKDGTLVASMQAITNAILFGLVQCFGGFVWGCLLDYFSGRFLFAVAACYTTAVMLIIPLLAFLMRKLPVKHTADD